MQGFDETKEKCCGYKRVGTNSKKLFYGCFISETSISDSLGKQGII